MTMPILSICVPLKVNNSFRLRNWQVLANELTALAKRRGDIEIIVVEFDSGHAAGYEHIKQVQGTGEFSRSRARNQAWRESQADLICFNDLDVLIRPADWDKAITEAPKYDACSPFTTFQRLGELKTKNRCPNDLHWNWNLPVNTKGGGSVKFRAANLAGGIMFCKRSFMEAINGWDERFKGWGSEDTAIEKIANRKGFKVGYIENKAIHLYHPPDREGRNQTKGVWKEHYQDQSPSTDRTTLAVPCPNYPGRGLKGDHPVIKTFVAVTSLSPSTDRIDRQTECLDTWKAFGLTIVSVNSASEVAELQSVYPQVDSWVSSEGEDAPRINELLNVAIDRDQPILIINSDIEIRGEQSSLLDAITPGHMTCGVRYNYDETWWKCKREPWGIDVFYIEPEFAKIFPRLPMRIGKPVWDYWLQIHADRNQVPSRYIGYGLFFHRDHVVNWTKNDSRAGVDVVADGYSMSPEQIKYYRDQLPFGKHYRLPDVQYIVAAGMPRSCSTWLFNAVRLILEKRHPSIWSGWHRTLYQAGDSTVRLIKIHDISHLPKSPSAIFYSWRDIRESIASCRRIGFDVGKDPASWMIANDRAFKARADCVFRYDDLVNSQVECVRIILKTLGEPEEKSEQIVAAVNAIQMPKHHCDLVTGYHPGHISDGNYPPLNTEELRTIESSHAKWFAENDLPLRSPI